MKKNCVCDSGHEYCCGNKRKGLGHTAYNHVGNDGLEGLGNSNPSSPYYNFGYQHRFPYNWAGGAGGSAWATSPAAETRGLSGLGSLGNADILESGLEPLPGAYSHNPAFARTMLHDPRYVPTGDWPLIRPQGPEPMGFDPFSYFNLSDSERKFAMLALAGLGGFLLWKKLKSRPRANPARNPKRVPYSVIATTKRKRRKGSRYGTIGFTTKSSAAEYAEYLRLGGHKARVKRNPRRRRRSRR